MIKFVTLAIFIIYPSNECAEGQLIQEKYSTGASHIPADACRIGQLPKNGWVEYANPPYKRLTSDDYVNSLTSVNYKCKDYHVMDGSAVNICFKEKWVSTVPECKPYCSPNDISSSSIVPTTCSHKNVTIECSEPAPPDTFANIICRDMYKRSSDKNVQVTSCGDNGVWTPPPEECSATCGKVTPNAKSPWIAKVSRYVRAFLVYDFGTIINARVVLSIADQFWNRTEQKTNDLSEFWIQIEIGSNILQKIELERIAYAPNHDKFINAPSGNIVVVILRTSIEFKSGVMPVCLPFELYADGAIPSSFEGRTPEQDNIVLQHPEICYSEWESSNPPSSAMDVLCTNRTKTVGKYIGTGSSFAVPIENNGSKVFYLLGIRTWWHNYGGVKYYQFQNILFYKDFIRDEISKITISTPSSVDSTIANSTMSSFLPDKMTYCRLDNIPKRGNAYYDSNREQKLEYGEKIHNLIAIGYRCIENHLLYGDSTNYCVDGKWLSPEPECRPRCNPKEIQGWTLVANCQFQENNTLKQTSCTEPAVPGTIAFINCQRGYQRFGSHLQTSVCGSDGRWSPLPEKCTVVCGEISVGGAYIVGGKISEISKVSWHAGIYREYRENHGLEQICGGSIITVKVVVSAIHCFWDSSKNTIRNKEEYEIAVGKSQRQLEENEKLNPQFFKIEDIFYEEGYNDYAGNYANDIAVVILNKYIEFKSYIVPVCINFGLKYDDKIVQPGLVGKVAGWGLEATSGESSPTLKEIDLPVVSRKDCIEHSTEEFRKFITSDKFCAGYLTGVSVCLGDSGGGLVFAQTQDTKTVYYLRGIVSTGANKQGSCDNDKYATFTNIAYYADLIDKYYLEYQPNL